MSAILDVPTESEIQVASPGKSYQDYMVAVDEHPRLRVEYINGEIIMTPAPIPLHQIAVRNLLLLMNSYILANDLGEVLPAPLDVELETNAQIVQPDLIFIAKERVAKLIGETRIIGAPDLAVEILSPATARTDRKRKLPLYAAHGLAEYWIVDPDDQSVEVYLLDGTAYRVAGIFLEGEMVDVGRFAQAGIAVDQVFAL